VQSAALNNLERYTAYKVKVDKSWRNEVDTMFTGVRTILGWIFQAIVTTVVVELVMGYFRRARERAAAAQAPAQPTHAEEPSAHADEPEAKAEKPQTHPEEPPARAEKDTKPARPAARPARRTRRSQE
jgi:predicted lipid-binding transport protein (Tim44 family)